MRLTIDLAFEVRPPHQFCLSGVERQNLGTLSHCLVLQFGYFSEMIVGGEICLWGRAEWPILSLQLNVGCTVLTVADFPILRQAHESLVVFTAEG